MHRVLADHAAMGTLSRAVTGLLTANAILFVLTHLVPGRGEALQQQLALWFPRHAAFQPWQFVTYAFLHGGFTHLAFNMLALASFGPHLERLWRTRRFLIFYLVCAVGAALIHTAVHWFEYRACLQRLLDAGLSPQAIQYAVETQSFVRPGVSPEIRESFRQLYTILSLPAVGASGAIYGLLVAFGLTYPNARLMLILLPIPIKAKYLIPALLGLDLLGGLTGFSLFGLNIAHFAHLGGAAIGFLMTWYWRSVVRRSAFVAASDDGES